MTLEDLARLTEEERRWYGDACKRIGAWDERPVDTRLLAALTRLAQARRVVEAAQRWDQWGKIKAIHVLTCKDCERLEGAEHRWCDEAARIARTQLDAGKAIMETVAAHDAEVGGA